jgi:peptidoglycan/xylan/chitin deacetylase (PgdA/CDA1 family)
MLALMYHDIVAAGAEDSSGFPGRDAALYKVTPEQFDAHLSAIAARAADPIITFDDGGAAAMRAVEALDRHGLRGHFFVTTNFIGTKGFLDETDLRELHRRGHVVGSHSCSHPLRMGHCRWPQLVDEWSRSRAVLSDLLGQAVTVASVPGGDFAPVVAEAAAQAGFTRLFTSEPTRDVKKIGGLELRGRFTIQRWTTAHTVGALAAGAWLPAARQVLVWNAKKATKRLGGARYLHLRKLLLGHGNDVRWGDQT